MNALHNRFRLRLPLAESMAWVGAFATAGGQHDAATSAMAIARDLAGKRGADGELMGVEVEVECVHVLCQACDYLRESGQLELVSRIEGLVAELKHGRPRLITATLNQTVRTVGELDGALESMRRNLIAGGAV